MGLLPLAFNTCLRVFYCIFLVIIVGRIYFVHPIAMNRAIVVVFEAVSVWCPTSAATSGLVEYWAVFQSMVREDFFVGLVIFQFSSDVWGFIFDDPVISLFRFCVRTMLTVVIWYLVYWKRDEEGAEKMLSHNTGVYMIDTNQIKIDIFHI